MRIGDMPQELLNEIIKHIENNNKANEIMKYLEDSNEPDEIIKTRYKSVQRIKVVLARLGDEKSKQLLKQIIEIQVPDIEEITRRYIEDEYTAATLSAEYGINQIVIRRLISEYAFITDREKQYDKRGKHKEATMYRPREKKTEEQQINIIINPSILQSQSLTKEGEDR